MADKNDADSGDTGADDLFDDFDEGSDSDSDADAGNEPPVPATPDTGKAGEADMVREAIAECAELGIVVPDSVSDCNDFVQHFLTAMKTHKSTKALSQGSTEAVATSGDAQPTEEEQPTMMSLSRHFDPAVRTMGAELETSKRKKALKRINALEKNGVIKPDHAKQLREQAGAIQLSLTREGNLARQPLDDVLDALEQVPVTAVVRLNTLETIANPLETDADVEEIVAKISSGKKRRVPETSGRAG